MSLYGRNTKKAVSVSTVSTYPRDENLSSIANRAGKHGSPKRTHKKAPAAPTSPPRSPFVTPNHPLYVFGDDQFNNNNTNVSKEFEPSAPQKTKNCLDSMQQMSLSTPPREEKPSPFRKLQLSNAFDNTEGSSSSSSSSSSNSSSSQEERQQIYQTPFNNNSQEQQQIRLPHRIIRKSTTFGMERMREMSIDSPLKQKLLVIEEDLEGEFGLARRLCRMKRRLFLENVVSSPRQDSPEQEQDELEEEEQPLDTTPKHSNTTTMEGMEVVLEDEEQNNTTTTTTTTTTAENENNNNDHFYLTFSTSSESLQMEIDPDEEATTPKMVLSSSSAPAPHKLLSGDSSVVTEATAACSTFGDDSYNWASLSSISEQE